MVVVVTVAVVSVARTSSTSYISIKGAIRQRVALFFLSLQPEKYKLHYMKKFILPIVAVLFLASACKQEAEKDYMAEIQAQVSAFEETYMSIVRNTELSDDEKDDAMNAEYDKMAQEIAKIAREGLKKHNDDSTAVMMVLAMEEFEITDGEGILGLIENLGPNAQAFQEMQALKSLYEKKNITAEGTKFVDFEIVQPDGRVAKLSDYAGKGKYCLVDFWASWCGPCKREIPTLQAVYDKYVPKGLEMVSVAVWDKVQESIDTAKAYNIRWNHILDAQQVPTDLYAIQGIPHIMLIGPDGTILKRDLRGKAIAEELEKYL